MIEKLNKYKTSEDGAYAQIVDKRDIIDKVNEIIDFLNDTYLMKVKDGKNIILDDCVNVPGYCTDIPIFVTGLSVADDVVHSDIESVTTVTSDIKCPHCGVSYYTIEESLSTCVYYPPIIKDGVNINPDRNKTTTRYRCLNCQKEFDIKGE